jgi:hypothetical protein
MGMGHRIENKINVPNYTESSSGSQMISNNLISCNYFVKNHQNFSEIVSSLNQKHPGLNIEKVASELDMNQSMNLKQIFYTKEYKISYRSEKPKVHLKKSKIELFTK